MRARSTWLAAATFASVAIAMTGIVRGSGEQIVDTGRYQTYAESVDAGLVPYRDFALEYPPGALALFVAPLIAGSDDTTYFWAFAALMAAAGALGVVLTSGSLARLGRSERTRRGVLALLAFSPLAFGGVLLTRFDIVVAALVAAATLALLAGRTRTAALAIGIGAAVKLYPLLLVPFVAASALRRSGRREAAVTALVPFAVLGAVYSPFFVVAPGGVAESLWRQLTRPLQIESLGAGVLVVAHHAAGLALEVDTSFGSQNLVGALPAGVAIATSIAGVLAVTGTWLVFTRRSTSAERSVRACATVLVAFVAFGKVLSPQFLVWLLFPSALVGGRRGALAGACFALAAITTAIWFPWRYFELPRELDPLVASLVVVRGVALVAAFAILVAPSRATHSA